MTARLGAIVARAHPELLPLMRSPTTQTFAANGVALVLGLATSIQIARWLGPAGRGSLAAAMLWPTLIVHLVSLGLATSIVYHVAQDEARRGRILAAASAMGLIQSLVGCLVGFVALPALLASQSPDVIAAGRLFLLVVPFSLLLHYGMAVLQGTRRFTAFNVMRLIVPAGYLAGAVALFLTDRLSVSSIVALHIGLNVTAFVVCAALLSRAGAIELARFETSDAVGLLRYGVKVHAGTLSQVANLRLDQAFLSAFFAPVYLGYYVTAVSAASLLSVASDAVQRVMLPKVAAAREHVDRAEIIGLAFSGFLRLSFAFSVLLAVLMPWLLPLMFGQSFAPAVPAAIVLTLGTLFLSLKDVLAGGAMGIGDPWLASRSEILALGVTVVGLLVLLPPLGIMGAAVATTAAYGTQLVIVVRGLRGHGISARSLFMSAGTRSINS